MATFKNFPKTQLRIGAHYTVMEAFKAKLAAAAFTPAKLAQLATKFTAALADEDKYLKQSTASAYSKQLAETDGERDKLYSIVKQTATTWAESGFDPQATAATALLALVNLYKIDVHAQYDQETGLLTNILTDMATAENAAHVATLGLADVVADLKEKNEQMKTLMASRSDERSTKVTGALKAARAEVNALYDQLTRLIESYSETADDASPYDTFIAEWNAEVVRVKQQAAGTASASKTAGKTTAKLDPAAQTPTED